MERPALCVLDVEESFAWGDDLIDTQFKPAGNPIFLIDLQMDEQKAYYTTNPDKFVVGAFPFYRSNDIAFHSIKANVSKTQTRCIAMQSDSRDFPFPFSLKLFILNDSVLRVMTQMVHYCYTSTINGLL